ncbi:MAG: hypothetical protein NC092_09915 [Butyrivibrio sp.]|nr:hypothetical protein [Muribaculum sp.]MCM1552994.1 hypothetical protein [Butyrivibrio sp.]
MLVVQDICLSWGKEERGAACAEKRVEFPQAYSMDKLPNTFHGDVMVHRLYFRQKGLLFQNLRMNEAYRFQAYTSVRDLNLTNLSVQSDSESYEVTFFCDEHRSHRPIRRGHNKDYHNMESALYRHDILNETAFSLRQGQYGRVIWNERRIDYDTGEWYYHLHISNLMYALDSGEMPQKDIFLLGEPNFMYKQMAALL